MRGGDYFGPDGWADVETVRAVQGAQLPHAWSFWFHVPAPLLRPVWVACLVVLAFMRNWRTTFIAAVAIPASVVATFGVMWALNFTLNSVTMLGAEIFGRSYGGGVLKMEPREASTLPMPSPELLEAAWQALKMLS